jgi:flagellar basal-body rod modification protein FlgD
MSTIDPTSATTSGTAATPQATSNPGLQVNETQFLQLMVDQLQHQDPTNPSDPTDFVSQLAQLTSVEQQTNVATNTQNSEYVSLLGHTVSYTDASGAVQSGLVKQVDLSSSGATLSVGDATGISATSVTSVS